MKDLLFLFSGIASLVLVWILVVYTSADKIEPTLTDSTSASVIAVEGSSDVIASYLCASDIMLTATFHNEEAKAPEVEGGPPEPQGSVSLINSEGIKVELKQTVSADGARYADPTDQFVFWSKGDGALVLERGTTSSMYRDCIIVAPKTERLTQMFYRQNPVISLRYPAGWQVRDTNTAEIGGLAGGVELLADITVPAERTEGTNLSGDSGVRIARITDPGESCTPDMFLENSSAVGTSTINDTLYLVASSTDSGAGNLYERTAYVQEGVYPCVAGIGLIHSTELQNYPEGTVAQFDRTGLTEDYIAILNTLHVLR